MPSSRVSDAYFATVEDRIVALYRDDGWSLRAIAAHVNVGEETCRRVLIRKGVPRRPRGPVSPKYARDNGVPTGKPRKRGALLCASCGAETGLKFAT
jgi:hypothetical protein